MSRVGTASGASTGSAPLKREMGLPSATALVVGSREEGSVMAIDEGLREDALRERAIKRLKKRRDFTGHVLVYILVNTFLVLVWALTDAGFFWPVFPIVGWGIGVVMNAWDVYRDDEFDDERIRREMEHLRHHG